MRLFIIIPCLVFHLIISNTGVCQKNIHKIILRNEIHIDTTEIKKLDEPLRGILALYSAMGGTDCYGEHCGLTTALGLGEQGSDAHKALILKYFPDDKVAKAVVAQDCYLRPGGASTFTEYNYLTLVNSKDTVKVYYKWYYYDHGEITEIKGPDIYIFRDNKFRMLKRKLWSHVDK